MQHKPKFQYTGKPQPFRHKAGFTLVELLMVVLIMGLLATIAIPIFNGQREIARNGVSQSAVRNGLTAAKAYVTQKENYVGITYTEMNKIEPTISATPWYITPASPDPAGSETNPGAFNILYLQTNSTGTFLLICGNPPKGNEIYCILDVIGAIPGLTLPIGSYYGNSKNNIQDAVNDAVAGSKRW
jgi:prepilin-type N-terminal cleavage/methylation domain-containing protein